MYARAVGWLQRHLGLTLCRVVSRPLDPAPSDHGRLAHVRYAVMKADELIAHCADRELELSSAQVRAAFARGDLCVGALDGETLVGYEWFAFGPTPHVKGVCVEFDFGARYGYKQFVRPAYRGRRIAAGLSSHGDYWCMRRGCNRTVAFIQLENFASWRASARLGSRTVGYAGYLDLFGVVLPFRTRGARDLGFRFYKLTLAPIATSAAAPS
jgi:GNAT superfamily N-acetyltransferase